MDDQYIPPKRVWDWALENENKDTMADAYIAVCSAIGIIHVDAVTESSLFNKLTGEDQSDEFVEMIDEKASDAIDAIDTLRKEELFRSRNELAQLIDYLLNLDS